MIARLAVLVVICTVANAWADKSKPWATGVPEAQQARANALFDEANDLFEQRAHAQAVEKYRAAIALWDHPMIRFNMAVTLIRLELLVEAASSLDAALRFGDAPFTPELYAQALDYQALVRGRVGTIVAECTQAGAQVWLDGKRWFACPGTQEVRVLAGEHLLLAEKAGSMTVSRQVFVTGASTSREPIELVPIEARWQYPTRRWIPWTVAGAGATVGLVGVGVWFAARNQMDRYDAQHAIECAMRCVEGLPDDPALRDQRDSALLKNRIAISMMVVGGVAAVAGVVWATVFNRPTRVLPDVDVSPAPGGGTASATWRF